MTADGGAGPTSAGPPLKRVYVNVSLSISSPTASAAVPWLVFQTNMFPGFANRKLTAYWKR
jgi:hypothetical protein